MIQLVLELHMLLCSTDDVPDSASSPTEASPESTTRIAIGNCMLRTHASHSPGDAQE